MNTGNNKALSVQTGKYLYDAAGKVYYSGDITGNADDLANVTLTPANIIVEPSEHGGVTTESGVYYAAKDDTVTLTVKPDASYELASLKVNGTEKKDEVSDDNTYAFTMPAGNVTVTPLFITEWQALQNAIDAATGDNPTVKLSDYAGADGRIVCPEGGSGLAIDKKLTLDLDGCVLDRGAGSGRRKRLCHLRRREWRPDRY